MRKLPSKICLVKYGSMDVCMSICHRNSGQKSLPIVEEKNNFFQEFLMKHNNKQKEEESCLRRRKPFFFLPSVLP
jgi:hypothetical protein